MDDDADFRPGPTEGSEGRTSANAPPRPTEVPEKSHTNAASRPAASDPGQRSGDGPPRTSWRIGFSLAAVITAYSSMFAIWDHSEFPDETLANYLYWLGIGIILTMLAIWSHLVRKRASILDRVIVIGLTLAAISTFAESAITVRDEKPSERRFTVAVFTFDADSPAKEAASWLREEIIDTLSRENAKDVEVRNRAREVKGEVLSDKLEYIRKWGRRKKGCHLAVWVHLRRESDGRSYAVTARYVKVYPFGEEVNPDTVGSLGEAGYFSDTFKAARIADGKSLGKDAVDKVLSSVRFAWGLASYQKADYDTVLQVLPKIGYSNAEYYAGAAARIKSMHTREGKQLLQEASAHLDRAISMHEAEDRVKATYYQELGAIQLNKLVTREAKNPKREGDKAVLVLSKSAEIFKKERLQQASSYSEVLMAQSLYELHNLETERGEAEEKLARAERILLESLSDLSNNRGEYFEAKSLLGVIYHARANHEVGSLAEKYCEKSIANQEEALHFFKEVGNLIAVTGVYGYLGEARAKYGTLRQDEKAFDQGMGDLGRGFELCSSLSIPDHCFKVHLSAAKAAIGWAALWTKGSSRWSSALDRGLKEFKLSESFLSSEGQPSLYGSVKHDFASITMELAPWKPTDERLRLLQVLLHELDVGIKALDKQNTVLRELYKDRALCYRALYEYSERPDERFLKLARRDEASSRKASMSSHR